LHLRTFLQSQVSLPFLLSCGSLAACWLRQRHLGAGGISIAARNQRADAIARAACLGC
jgi:hypothetical protein